MIIEEIKNLLIENKLIDYNELNMVEISINNRDISREELLTTYKMRRKLAMDMKLKLFIDKLIDGISKENIKTSYRILKIRGLINQNVICNSEFSKIYATLRI